MGVVRDIIFMQSPSQMQEGVVNEERGIIGSCMIGRRAQRDLWFAKRSKQGAGGGYCWDLESLLKKCWPTLLG